MLGESSLSFYLRSASRAPKLVYIVSAKSLLPFMSHTDWWPKITRMDQACESERSPSSNTHVRLRNTWSRTGCASRKNRYCSRGSVPTRTTIANVGTFAHKRTKPFVFNSMGVIKS